MILFFVLHWVSFISFSIYAQNPPAPSCDELIFESSILQNKIPVQIYLPVDYKQNKEKYQVHYVFDGVLASNMYTGIADHYSQLNLMPEIIVVGLNQNRRYGFVEFSEFLKEELVPYIDSAYRTVPFRLLAGHSSSGEQTLYELF